jgi:hypothetical protein
MLRHVACVGETRNIQKFWFDLNWPKLNSRDYFQCAVPRHDVNEFDWGVWEAKHAEFWCDHDTLCPRYVHVYSSHEQAGLPCLTCRLSFSQFSTIPTWLISIPERRKF